MCVYLVMYPTNTCIPPCSVRCPGSNMKGTYIRAGALMGRASKQAGFLVRRYQMQILVQGKDTYIVPFNLSMAIVQKPHPLQNPLSLPYTQIRHFKITRGILFIQVPSFKGIHVPPTHNLHCRRTLHILEYCA